MLEIRDMTWHDFSDTVCLYTTCFEDDPWFAKDGISFKDGMPAKMQNNILTALQGGLSIGSFDDYCLVGGLLVLNTSMRYNQPETWRQIFNLDADGSGSEDLMTLIPDNALYLLAGFVNPRLQRRGIYRSLLQELIIRYPSRTMVSDISNLGPMPMYRRMGFEACELEPGYCFIKRPGIGK